MGCEGFVVGFGCGESETFADVFGPCEGAVSGGGAGPFGPDCDVLGVASGYGVSGDLEWSSVLAASLFLTTLGDFSSESRQVSAEFGQIQTKFPERVASYLNIEARAGQCVEAGGGDPGVPAGEHRFAQRLSISSSPVVDHRGVNVDVPALRAVGDFHGTRPSSDVVATLGVLPCLTGGHTVPALRDRCPNVLERVCGFVTDGESHHRDLIPLGLGVTENGG